MIEALGSLLVVAGLIIFTTYGGYILGQGDAKGEIMKEAFDRGYAVQCVGKAGYYWECDQ